jgi:hypothetical protein
VAKLHESVVFILHSITSHELFNFVVIISVDAIHHSD